MPVELPKKTPKLHSFNGWDAEGEGNDFTTCNAFTGRTDCSEQVQGPAFNLSLY